MRDTRAVLVAAAIGTLRESGFAAASARRIAARAGCNQALIFYHFGSVPDLLVAGCAEGFRPAREQLRGGALEALAPKTAESLRADGFLFQGNKITVGDSRRGDLLRRLPTGARRCARCRVLPGFDN